MIRKFSIFLTALCCLMLAAVAPISAASSKVDFDAAAEAVSAVKPKALVTALETPMKASALPDGFKSAEYQDLTDQAVLDNPDTCLFDVSDIDGVVGAQGYDVKVDADVITNLYACSSLIYAVFDADSAETDLLKDFKTGAEEDKPAADDTGDYAVDDTEVDGQPAVVMTYAIEQDGNYVVVKVLVMQIANVLIIGSVTLGDFEEVDPEDAGTYAEALVLAGVQHLSDAATAAAN
jgi:hypothetical protein